MKENNQFTCDWVYKCNLKHFFLPFSMVFRKKREGLIKRKVKSYLHSWDDSSDHPGRTITNYR